MIRIVIDHNLVAIPTPVIDIAVVGWSDSKVEAVKPEPISPSSFEPVYLAATDAPPEASLFPGMIQVIAGIISARIMSDPAIVGVDVRSVRMSVLIAKVAILVVLRDETTAGSSRSTGRAMSRNVPMVCMIPAMRPVIAI
jgi:hypothetical protein